VIALVLLRDLVGATGLPHFVYGLLSMGNLALVGLSENLEDRMKSDWDRNERLKKAERCDDRGV
jgi:hypothetical protein